MIYSILFFVSVCSYIEARMPQTSFQKEKDRDEKWYLHKPLEPQKPKTPRTKKKVTRRGLTYLTEHKTFTQMNFTELKTAKNIQKEKGNFDITTKYLERLLVLCDDIDEKAALLIELADILYAMGKFDDAEKKYTEFVDTYPGNSLVERAFYHAIVCLSNKILSPDRDQTKTQQTVEKADAFLERASVFTTYANKVRDIRLHACKTLVDNHFNICQTSIKLGNYEGAQKRLELVRNQWLTELPEIALPLAHLEVQLGQEFEQFTPPASSFELVQMTHEVKPHKNDMVLRF